MDLAYAVAPLVGWLASGTLKFVINSARTRRLAYDQIGYGGLPSTHTTIVSTPAFLIGLRDGWNTPAFSVAAALLFIVILDATSLRRQIGHHASRLNIILRDAPGHLPLRERMGHRVVEVLVALIVGFAIARLLLQFSPS